MQRATKKEREDFQELIRSLIDKEKTQNVQEFRKQIFQHLGLSSELVFKLTDPILAKMSLLALSGSVNAQSVYAEALKSALLPHNNTPQLQEDDDSKKSPRDDDDNVTIQNKLIFFTNDTGQRLLIRLIDASWSKSKSNDFCDYALDHFCRNIFELICKLWLFISRTNLLFFSFCLSNDKRGANNLSVGCCNYIPSHYVSRRG
jgi:hypothetical protein